MSRIAELEQNIVSVWEDIAEARGFERVVGTVICTLIIENRPLSQKEIAERTGYSIPTVSKTLRTLLPLGSVRKTKKPGSRVTLYHVEMHPLEIFSGTLTRWVVTAKTMGRRMAEIREELEDAESEDPERVKKLLGVLGRFADPIPKTIEIIEKAIVDIQRLLKEERLR